MTGPEICAGCAGKSYGWELCAKCEVARHRQPAVEQLGPLDLFTHQDSLMADDIRKGDAA